MTNFEIKRLCAEAMQLRFTIRNNSIVTYTYQKFSPGEAGNGEDIICFSEYDPLQDDAQAMALVKKHNMEIERSDSGRCKAWIQPSKVCSEWHTDLNRAICECVAKMQVTKTMERGIEY